MNQNKTYRILIVASLIAMALLPLLIASAQTPGQQYTITFTYDQETVFSYTENTSASDQGKMDMNNPLKKDVDPVTLLEVTDEWYRISFVRAGQTLTRYLYRADNLKLVPVTQATAAATTAPEATVVAPTATLAPAQPTATAVAPVSTDWGTIAPPPSPDQLPSDQMTEINYLYTAETGDSCADRNDPSETCSTKIGQGVKGKFILPAKHAYTNTGDGVVILETEKAKDPITVLDKASQGRLSATKFRGYLIVNTSDKDLDLWINAPTNHWRGFYQLSDPADVWSVAYAQHLFELTLSRALLPFSDPSWTPTPTVQPTPVANCGNAKNGCQTIVFYILIWDGTKWHKSAGVYFELNRSGKPNWETLKLATTAQ